MCLKPINYTVFLFEIGGEALWDPELNFSTKKYYNFFFSK